ncbi:glycosyltransferase [bacterium]|nr:glycosyltransferase [bacterium]
MDELQATLRASALVRKAREAFRTGGFEEGVQRMEMALDTDPASLEAVELAREIERRAGEDYLRHREARLLDLLEQAWPTKQRPIALLKCASFYNAPSVMSWIRDQVQNETGPPATLDDEGDYPYVSVIVPFLEMDEDLDETLESVFAQTHPGWELILVSDRDKEVSHSLVEVDGKKAVRQDVKTVKLEGHRSVGMLGNMGATRASAPWIVFLYPGTRLAPMYIERTLQAAFEHPDAAWIAPLEVCEGYLHQICGFERYDTATLLQHDQFVASSLIRRHVFRHVGGFVETQAHGWESWEFWVHASAMGYQPRPLRDVLLFRTVTQDAQTSTDADLRDRYLQARTAIIKNNPDLYLPLDEEAEKLLALSGEIPLELIDTVSLERVQRRPNPLKNEPVAFQRADLPKHITGRTEHRSDPDNRE